MSSVSPNVKGFIPAQIAILLLAAIALQPDPDNPRKTFVKEDLELLGADMKRRGILVPLIVRRNGDVYIVIDGHRRLAAALLVGIEKLPCIVVDANTTASQARQIQLVTSLLKADLNAYERYVGFSSLKALTPGMNNRQLAAEVGVTEGLVSMVLSLDKCIPPVKLAAGEGKIGLNDWYALSRLPEEQQASALSDALNGKKPKGNGDEHAQRSRSKLFLPSGIEFTVSATEMSLEELRSAIRDLQRLADEAKDVETLCDAMKVAKSEGVTDVDVIAKALKSAKDLANNQELDLRTLMKVAKGKKHKVRKEVPH